MNIEDLWKYFEKHFPNADIKSMDVDWTTGVITVNVQLKGALHYVEIKGVIADDE